MEKLISPKRKKGKDDEFDRAFEHILGSEFTLWRVVCIFGAFTMDLFLASSSTPIFFFGKAHFNKVGIFLLSLFFLLILRLTLSISILFVRVG